MDDYADDSAIADAEELEDETEYIIDRIDETGSVIGGTIPAPKKEGKRIPNLKEVSYILNGGGNIKYDGRRQMRVDIRFNEDAENLNRMMEGGNRGYKVLSPNGKLKKGPNVLEFNVPELRIVDDESYRKIAGVRESRIIARECRDNERYEQIYKPYLRCLCGEAMLAKMEAGRRYYRCPSAANKT